MFALRSKCFKALTFFLGHLLVLVSTFMFVCFFTKKEFHRTLYASCCCKHQYKVLLFECVSLHSDCHCFSWRALTSCRLNVVYLKYFPSTGFSGAPRFPTCISKEKSGLTTALGCCKIPVKRVLEWLIT